MYTDAGKSADPDFKSLCETAYNARAAVPNSVELMVAWSGVAEDYRRSAECALGIPYLEPMAGGTARTKLDIFWPEATDRQSCPIALFVHGGYWQSRDRDNFSHLAKGLNQNGVAVVMPSYDLCPHVNIGEIEDQIAAACSWVWRNYGRRIAVGGHSAGGHLTAAMMVRDFGTLGAPSDLVTNGLPISGLFDLRDLIVTSINDNIGMSLEDAEKWSPLLHDAPTKGNLHAWVGGDESEAFHWQTRKLAKKWKKAGLTTSYHSTKGANHFTIISDLADPESKMTRQFADLARNALEN